MLGKNLKRLFAAGLAATMTLTALPAVLAAEDTATETENSFLYCDTWLPFNSGDTECEILTVGEKYHDTFTCTTNGTTSKANPWCASYNETKKAWSISTNGNDGYQTRVKLRFGIITPHIPKERKISRRRCWRGFLTTLWIPRRHWLRRLPAVWYVSRYMPP